MLLRSLGKRSRKRPYTDAWYTLGAIKHETPNGIITGAGIKSAFRHRLLERQDGRCCYCRRWLVNTAYAKPIEHILPRKHYPQFSMEYWNLAVACCDCNSAKTDDVWGSISQMRRRYPKPREFTDAFHPCFHRYDQHIRYVRLETNETTVTLFTGLTQQGQHLCRSLLHKSAAKETLVKNNPVLGPALEEIRSFEAKAEGLNLSKFTAFLDALEDSFLRLLS